MFLGDIDSLTDCDGYLMKRYVAVMVLILTLESCSHVPQESSCVEVSETELRYIDPHDIEDYWIPAQMKKGYETDSAIAEAIAEGVAGYVLVEQTVTDEGNLTDIDVIDSYPPGFFVEQMAKNADANRLVHVTCSPVSVRYQAVYLYINGPGAFERIKSVYHERISNLPRVVDVKL